MIVTGLTDFLPILDAEYLLRWFGEWALWGIVAVIIVETGMLFPLLPGDSLLFTAGVFTANGVIQYPIQMVVAVTGGAAVAGPQLGYWLGRGIGPRIFERKDSRWHKKAWVDKTHEFFERYGGRAIVLGQFVPFVRTYLPVAAGVGKMPWTHFTKFNLIGAAVWGVGVTVAGYFLGSIPVVRDNYEFAVLTIVFVSLLPIIIEWIRHRIAARKARQASAQTAS